MRDPETARQRPSDQVETLADNGYDISVSPSVDTVQRTVTVDGSDFDIDAIGKVEPGGEVTATVTAPSGAEYNIEIRDQDEFVVRLASSQQGDSTVTFDTGSGAVDRTGRIGGRGHHHETGERTRHAVGRPPGDGRLGERDRVRTDDGGRLRRHLSGHDRATIERSAGEYNLAVIVITGEFSDSDEPVEFSDPQPLSVVENRETLAADWTVSTGSRLQYSRPAVDADRVFVGGTLYLAGAGAARPRPRHSPRRRHRIRYHRHRRPRRPHRRRRRCPRRQP